MKSIFTVVSFVLFVAGCKTNSGEYAGVKDDSSSGQVGVSLPTGDVRLRCATFPQEGEGIQLDLTVILTLNAPDRQASVSFVAKNSQNVEKQIPGCEREFIDRDELLITDEEVNIECSDDGEAGRVYVKRAVNIPGQWNGSFVFPNSAPEILGVGDVDGIGLACRKE